VVYVDNDTSARSLAARMLCQSWFGILPGDRQARFWGRPLASGRYREKLKDLALNRLRFDSLALESGRISNTLSRMRRFGIEYLYGYASLIRLFANRANYDDAADIFGGLKAVISTSETLSEGQQKDLRDRFRCPVVNEYGCSEVDVISFQCPEGGNHVVAGNLLVEIVRFGGEPEGFGTVLVTDLNNSLMPVIRYKVGDLAPLETSMCSCGRGWECMGRVLGRAQGQYVVVPGKGLLHSQFVVYMVEDMVAAGIPLGRFRIIQEEDLGLTVQVHPEKGATLDTEAILARLKAESADVLGPDFTWMLEIVHPGDIKTTPAGKFSHFESRVR